MEALASTLPPAARQSRISRRCEVLVLGSGAPAAAGVGKTRLAVEVLGEAGRRGLDTLWTVATEAAASVPYGPVVDLLPEPEQTHPQQGARGSPPQEEPSTRLDLLQRTVRSLGERRRGRGLVLLEDAGNRARRARRPAAPAQAALPSEGGRVPLPGPARTRRPRLRRRAPARAVDQRRLLACVRGWCRARVIRLVAVGRAGRAGAC